MLRKITMENFTTFKERTTIDFSKTNYTILPQNVASNGVLKGGILVGGNCAGKTNVFHAIRVLLTCLYGAPTSALRQPYLCVFGDKPSYRLEFEFQIQNHILCYSFEVLSDKEFVAETLLLDGTLLLERTGTTAKWYLSNPAGMTYDASDVVADRLFLPTLYHNTKWKGYPILQEWMDFLRMSTPLNIPIHCLIDYNPCDPIDREDALNLPNYIKAHGCRKINQFLDTYHLGLRIEAVKPSDVPFCPPNACWYNEYVIVYHDGLKTPIPIHLESQGTQDLLGMLPILFTVLSRNCLFLIDDFSHYFHPELEAVLIKFFMENAKQTQLLIASHSTSLLNNTVFRPDQAFAITFDGSNGSHVTRLSDKQPRSAQNIEKMYRDGVFGGLPAYGKSLNQAKT